MYGDVLRQERKAHSIASGGAAENSLSISATRSSLTSTLAFCAVILICCASFFCEGVNDIPLSVASPLRLGTNLSSIAIPPFWPVLLVGKEKRIDLAFLEHRKF